MGSKYDMFGQDLNIDDYVCCTSSVGSTGMYIAKIEKITDRKVRVKDRKGKMHQKSHNKVFVITAQIDDITELMI